MRLLRWLIDLLNLATLKVKVKSAYLFTNCYLLCIFKLPFLRKQVGVSLLLHLIYYDVVKAYLVSSA